MKLRRETIQKFWCPSCGSGPGQPCVIEGTGEMRTALHRPRIEEGRAVDWGDAAGRREARTEDSRWRPEDGRAAGLRREPEAARTAVGRRSRLPARSASPSRRRTATPHHRSRTSLPHRAGSADRQGAAGADPERSERVDGPQRPGAILRRGPGGLVPACKPRRTRCRYKPDPTA